MRKQEDLELERKEPEIYTVSLVPGELIIEHYWEELQKLLDAEPELWNKTFTKENIRERILSTEIQVWAVFNGRVIRLMFFTQRYVSPNGIATLQVFWMFGTDIRGALELVEEAIDRFAITLECQRIEVTGRRGWERLLKPLGGEFQYSVFSRPVKKMREN